MSSFQGSDHFDFQCFHNIVTTIQHCKLQPFLWLPEGPNPGIGALLSASFVQSPQHRHSQVKDCFREKHIFKM